MNTPALTLVIESVEAMAEELGYDHLKTVSAESSLYGGESSIDSLSLVRLVVEIEREVETRFGKHIVLADERAMSMRRSPFLTVGTLAALLEERLGELRD